MSHSCVTSFGLAGRPAHDLDAVITGFGKQGVKGPGGRRIDADYEITTYEPGRRLAFRATAGPVRPTGAYAFDEVDGRTRLTFSLQAELSGFKKLLMGGAVQKTMDAEVAATERLKQILEAPQAG